MEENEKIELGLVINRNLNGFSSVSTGHSIHQIPLTPEEQFNQKIKQLEEQLKNKSDKSDLLQQELIQTNQNFEEFIQIENAHNALITALKNTEIQITNNNEFSELLGLWALVFIIFDIIYILFTPFTILSNIKFYNLIADKVGMWGFLFVTFPALLILLIALALLRHQKQLIAEIRHYSMLKHKIELYGGILKAAQFIAFAQNSEENNSIKETFNEIKAELLKSPNFDLNAQPHIFPEEGGNLVEMLKSITELLKISTEANKAIAESAKKATTSEK